MHPSPVACISCRMLFAVCSVMCHVCCVVGASKSTPSLAVLDICPRIRY